MPCRIARATQWKLRLIHELDSWDQACFITLTYNDEHVPFGGTLVKRDLQLFFKRLRKSLDGKKIRYYACGEYGGDYGRPHYHAIVFGTCFSDVVLFSSVRNNNSYCNTYTSKSLEKTWGLGFCTVGSVTADSCQYVTGYVEKKLYGDVANIEYGDRIPPFQVQSQGLGLDFAKNNREQLESQMYTTIKGKKICLPRYYVDKLNLDKNLLQCKARISERKFYNSNEYLLITQKIFSEEELNKLSFRQKKLALETEVSADRRRRETDLKTKLLFSRNKKIF
jgi:hypothetical protein